MSNRSDNFTRADSNTSLGAPSDAGSAWVPTSGTWGIATNQGYAVSATGSQNVYLESSLSMVDVVIGIGSLGAAQEIGVCGRLINDGNNLVYIYSSVDGGLGIFKRIGGVYTQYGGFTAQSPDPTSLGICFGIGNKIRVLASGHLVTGYDYTSIDSSLATATKHGLYTTNSGVRYSSFNIYDRSSAVISVSGGPLQSGTGNQTLTLTAPSIPAGVWGDGSTTFSLSGGTGVSLVSQSCTTRRIWSDADSSALANVYAADVTVGTVFQSSVDAWVVGVKFYKDVTNTGVHLGKLWSGSGTLMNSVTFSGETASGWQTMLFSSPTFIKSGTNYCISVRCPVNFSAALNYFASSGHTNGFLTAPATGSATPFGSNGVYANGDTFPNQTTSANWFGVDPLVQSDAASIVVNTNGAVAGTLTIDDGLYNGTVSVTGGGSVIAARGFSGYYGGPRSFTAYSAYPWSL